MEGMERGGKSVSMARSDLAETADDSEPLELGVVGFSHCFGVEDEVVNALEAAAFVFGDAAAGDAPKWKTPAAIDAAEVEPVMMVVSAGVGVVATFDFVVGFSVDDGVVAVGIVGGIGFGIGFSHGFG